MKPGTFASNYMIRWDSQPFLRYSSNKPKKDAFEVNHRQSHAPGALHRSKLIAQMLPNVRVLYLINIAKRRNYFVKVSS